MRSCRAARSVSERALGRGRRGRCSPPRRTSASGAPAATRASGPSSARSPSPGANAARGSEARQLCGGGAAGAGVRRGCCGAEGAVRARSGCRPPGTSPPDRRSAPRRVRRRRQHVAGAVGAAGAGSGGGQGAAGGRGRLCGRPHLLLDLRQLPHLGLRGRAAARPCEPRGAGAEERAGAESAERARSGAAHLVLLPELVELGRLLGHGRRAERLAAQHTADTF